MNTQDFIEKIQEGSLPDESKARIVAILNEQGVTFDSKELIKDIIQEAIDADMAEDLTDEDRVAIATSEASAIQQIDEVEADVQKNMDFVESELMELKNMAGDLDKVADTIEIESLKNNIQA